jgi:ribosomal protein S27E
MPTFEIFCPDCGAQDIKVKFDGRASCNGCGKILSSEGQKAKTNNGVKPLSIPAPATLRPEHVAPGTEIAVGKLYEGAMFELDEQRYIKVAAVREGKVTGQRLNKKAHCGDTWIRNGASSLDPDTIVIAR